MLRRLLGTGLLLLWATTVYAQDEKPSIGTAYSKRPSSPSTFIQPNDTKENNAPSAGSAASTEAPAPTAPPASQGAAATPSMSTASSGIDDAAPTASGQDPDDAETPSMSTDSSDATGPKDNNDDTKDENASSHKIEPVDFQPIADKLNIKMEGETSAPSQSTNPPMTINPANDAPKDKDTASSSSSSKSTEVDSYTSTTTSKNSFSMGTSSILSLVGVVAGIALIVTLFVLNGRRRRYQENDPDVREFAVKGTGEEMSTFVETSRKEGQNPHAISTSQESIQRYDSTILYNDPGMATTPTSANGSTEIAGHGSNYAHANMEQMHYLGNDSIDSSEQFSVSGSSHGWSSVMPSEYNGNAMRGTRDTTLSAFTSSQVSTRQPRQTLDQSMQEVDIDEERESSMSVFTVNEAPDSSTGLQHHPRYYVSEAETEEKEEEYRELLSIVSSSTVQASKPEFSSTMGRMTGARSSLNASMASVGENRSTSGSYDQSLYRNHRPTFDV